MFNPSGETERLEGDYGNVSASPSAVFGTGSLEITVAEHFNSADDIMVCDLKECSGSNIRPK